MSSDEENNGGPPPPPPRAASERGKSPGDPAIEAFCLFKSYLDIQLKDFKQDLKDLKPQKKPEVSLKKDSNKVQFSFNADLQEGLEQLLRMRLPNEAYSLASELVSKIKHRNKLIQIADNSPGGWFTVQEYEKPKLGSDSEDEKKLRQAEARAVKKLKSSKPSSTHAYHPYKRSSTFQNASRDEETERRDVTWAAPRSDVTWAGPRPDVTWAGPRRDVTWTAPRRDATWGSTGQPFRGQRSSSGREMCFSCGQRGHFRSECRAGEVNPRRVG